MLKVKTVMATIALATLTGTAMASTPMVRVTPGVTPDSNGKTVRAFSLHVVNTRTRDVLNDLLLAAGEKLQLSTRVGGVVTAHVDHRSFAQTLQTILRLTKNGDVWTANDIVTLNKAQSDAMVKDGIVSGFLSPNPHDTWAVAVYHRSARRIVTELKSGKAGAPFDETLTTSGDDKTICYVGDREKYVILRSMVAMLDK
jgi:hypothetical protein